MEGIFSKAVTSVTRGSDVRLSVLVLIQVPDEHRVHVCIASLDLPRGILNGISGRTAPSRTGSGPGRGLSSVSALRASARLLRYLREPERRVNREYTLSTISALHAPRLLRTCAVPSPRSSQVKSSARSHPRGGSRHLHAHLLPRAFRVALHTSCGVKCHAYHVPSGVPRAFLLLGGEATWHLLKCEV